MIGRLLHLISLLCGFIVISCQHTQAQLSGSYAGILGRPGEDFPIYGEVPATSFSCLDQQFEGIYGDPETQCQVFHMCQPQGVVHSFLCPNGTIFNQQFFTCDWWFNVDCPSSKSFYDLNSNIYETPVKPVDNNLDNRKSKKLDGDTRRPENEVEHTRRPATRRPATRAPFTRAPITRAPYTRTPFTRAPITRAPYTRAPTTRAPYTREPITRRPVTREPITRRPFNRVPVTRGPYTRAPVTHRPRTPATRRPFFREPITRRPLTISTGGFTRDRINNNPFIVKPDRKVRTDEPEVVVITKPTTRPLNVGRAITVRLPEINVFGNKRRVKPEPLPIIIPRQNIQIFPVGVGVTPARRPVETPPQNSFEDILDLELNREYSGRKLNNDRADDDVGQILSAFPGPRRL